MKFCSNCGASINDDAQFCTFCGVSTGAKPTPVAHPTPVPQPAPVVKPKKRKNGFMVAAWSSVIAVFLILAIVVSCSFGLFDGLFEDGIFGSSSVRDNDDDDDDDRDIVNDDEDDNNGIIDDDDDPFIPTPPSVAEYTITVWTPAEDQAEGNNWLVKMEDAFEAAHPEYRITWINETVSEGDATGFVTGDVTAAADVYMFANDQISTLANAGGLSPLGGAFKEQIETDNSEFMISTVTHTNGMVYGFPMTNNTWFLYYNKDVYTEEDVKSLETMLEKGKVCMPFTVGWNAGAFFWGVGGTVFGEKGTDLSAGVQLGDKGYDAALKMIEVATHPNCVVGGMDVGKIFSGEVDAAFSGSWSAAEVRAYMGDKMGVAQLPSFTIGGQTYNMTALGGTKCVGVNPNSGIVEGKQKACTEFAAFLASADAQLERYNMRGVIPAAKSLVDNETIKSDPIAVAEINTMTNCTIIQSGLPEMNNVWTPLTNFAGKCASGDINEYNYKEAVDALARQLTDEALGW